jgi:tetratricopeptide (TPR) repeat protein
MRQRITEMKSWRLLILGLSVLLVGSGCQHAASPSLEMQQKFFSSLKNSNPEEERAWRCAQYYQLAGRFDLALKELSTAVASDPQNVRLLNAMGSCYDRLGEHAKAREMYEKVLAQEAGNYPARNNLGYSYYLSGDLTRAETIFQEILAKNPGDTVARNNLGLVWCRQGHENKALSLWKKIDGDLLAQEKLTQVLAYLGKSGEKTVTASPNAITPQIPVARNRSEEKREKPVPPGELARSEKIPAANQPSIQVASDLEPHPVQPAKALRTPGKFPQEAQVKVEEVQMVIQPASYSPPSAGMNSANEDSIATLPPTTGLPGKFAPGKINPAQAKTLISAADLSQIDTAQPRSYYRPRQWKRYWKPRMVIYTPQEPEKPAKPMKDYLNTGLIHRSVPGGPEAAIY